MAYTVMGLGLGRTLIKKNYSYKELPILTVEQVFSHSFHRVIIIDYEVIKDKQSKFNNIFSETNQPTEEFYSILESLTQDKRNFVMIVSEKDCRTVDEWFGGIEKLAMSAEDGYFYKWDANDYNWQKLAHINDWYISAFIA